jgi:uncharacterized protein
VLRIVLLVLLVIVVLAWWMRRGVRAEQKRSTSQPATDASSSREPMARCPHCGVHVPQSQSWPGRGGAYCSAEHRAIRESESA